MGGENFRVNGLKDLSLSAAVGLITKVFYDGLGEIRANIFRLTSLRAIGSQYKLNNAVKVNKIKPRFLRRGTFFVQTC